MKNALSSRELLDRLHAAVEMHRAGGTMAEAFQAAFPDRQIIDPREIPPAELCDDERMAPLNPQTGLTDLDF